MFYDNDFLEECILAQDRKPEGAPRTAVCGKWKNAKGEPFATEQAVDDHEKSCSRCQDILSLHLVTPCGRTATSRGLPWRSKAHLNKHARHCSMCQAITNKARYIAPCGKWWNANGLPFKSAGAMKEHSRNCPDCKRVLLSEELGEDSSLGPGMSYEDVPVPTLNDRPVFTVDDIDPDGELPDGAWHALRAELGGWT